jgi:hypothetical protein
LTYTGFPGIGTWPLVDGCWAFTILLYPINKQLNIESVDILMMNNICNRNKFEAIYVSAFN